MYEAEEGISDETFQNIYDIFAKQKPDWVDSLLAWWSKDDQDREAEYKQAMQEIAKLDQSIDEKVENFRHQLEKEIQDCISKQAEMFANQNGEISVREVLGRLPCKDYKPEVLDALVNYIETLDNKQQALLYLAIQSTEFYYTEYFWDKLEKRHRGRTAAS